eukprot:9428207-Alexandrium_andersonii.AAC.1
MGLPIGALAVTTETGQCKPMCFSPFERFQGLLGVLVPVGYSDTCSPFRSMPCIIPAAAAPGAPRC